MRNPSVYTASQIKDWPSYELTKLDVFIPSRPLPFYGISLSIVWRTIKLTWGVFTGKYDALNWEDKK